MDNKLEDFLNLVVTKSQEADKNNSHEKVLLLLELTTNHILAGLSEETDVISNCLNCDSSNIIEESIFRCIDCNCFHDKNGNQL